MIVARLIGGLGNQMFQYAAGRALSLRKKNPFALDISSFDTYNLHHGFELHRAFVCNAALIDKKKLKKIIGWQANPLILKVLSRKSMKLIRSNRLVIEPHFEYWEKIDNLPNNCILMGYWQSEKYFADATKEIREDFKFRQIQDENNLRISEKILRGNSISIHVRRGDYINSAANKKIFSECALGYYEKAINYMAERMENPKFFIFSNDISWTKNELKIKFPAIHVDFNLGKESYNDMRLMSLCKHNIGANSSFSWWGAWLNESKTKIVIMPKSWFTPTSGIKDVDIVPSQWVRL